MLRASGRMADDAVKNQKPLYFGGGIRHGLENAETKLFLLTVLDASAGAALTKTLADAKDQIHKKEASLRDLVIAHNELPPDRYKGADKPALVERAIATWKEKQPDALVLTVRFPSEKWNRETYWRLQNTTWYKIDRSWVQAQLIVKENDRLAVIRPINLWIDHLAADKLTASPLHGSVKEELQPSSFMLVNKAK